MRDYTEIIAARRFTEGFTVREITDFMLTTGNIISNELLAKPELKGLEERVYDNILLTVQLAADEIEDSYALLQAQSPEAIPEIKEMRSPADSDDLKRIVRRLEDICTDAPDIGLSIDSLDYREEDSDKP